MSEDIKLDIIKCPTCGAEYLPVEIFIPNAFFGKPVHIERDEDGKIIDVVGNGMCTTEQFICEHCNVPFRISAKVQYNTKAETKFDFNSDYETSLKSESLFLQED